MPLCPRAGWLVSCMVPLCCPAIAWGDDDVPVPTAPEVIAEVCDVKDPDEACEGWERANRRIEEKCGGQLTEQQRDLCDELREERDDFYEDLRDEAHDRRTEAQKRATAASAVEEACQRSELAEICSELSEVRRERESRCGSLADAELGPEECEELADRENDLVKDELPKQEAELEFVRDESGRPIRDPIVPLLVGCSAGFLASYLGPLALLSADDYRNGAWVFAIPVVGPMTYVGKAHERWSPRSAGTINYAKLWPLFATVGLGLLQGATVAGATVGYIGKKRVDPNYRPVLSPVIGPGYRGFAMQGVF